jgi:acetyltransferase-like isoleucine patch superfamily enzyme
MLLNSIAFIVSLPARMKGMKIGKHVILAPGYEFVTYRYDNVTLHDNVIIGRDAFIQVFGKGKIDVGAGTHIGKNVTISSNNKIAIGKNCLFGYRVSILDHDHTSSGLSEGKKITIGNNCSIGAQSFILKGVTLGDGCVVGAGSVVTKSFPAGSVVAGNPAKIIKRSSNVAQE